MSRTPKADVSKLPIWARCMITDLEDRLALVTEERDEALGWCDNLETIAEGLAKQLEACNTDGYEERCTEDHGGSGPVPFPCELL